MNDWIEFQVPMFFSEFCRKGLNKAGTVIRVESKGTIKTIIIGHINELGGLCDGYMADLQRVFRYKVLEV